MAGPPVALVTPLALRYSDIMNSPKLHSTTPNVVVKVTGTTVWRTQKVKVSETAAAQKEASAKKATATKRPTQQVTVTILSTPLQPSHSTRAALEAAVRAVK